MILYSASAVKFLKAHLIFLLFVSCHVKNIKFELLESIFTGLFYSCILFTNPSHFHCKISCCDPLKKVDLLNYSKFKDGGLIMKKIIAVLTGSILFSFSAFATTPAQLSLPGSNIPYDQDVAGVRLSLLYGETSNVQGLDITFGLTEMDNFTGIEIAPFFLGGNKINNEFKGLAIGLLNWHEGQDTGVNWGGVNFVNNVNGANIGFLNITRGESLVDIGFVNYAESTSFQLGFVNATRHLNGLQVGLVNYAENGVFPVLPIVNFRKDL